jgi:putative transposon-encoded protein
MTKEVGCCITKNVEVRMKEGVRQLGVSRMIDRIKESGD